MTAQPEILANDIGGRRASSHGSSFVDVRNPALGVVIALTRLSTAADADAAVAAAKTAVKITISRWS